MEKCNYHIFFKTLGNKLRIDIVSELKEKEMSVKELGKKLKVEQSKLSHSLKCLKDCNLVECKQSGKNRIYSLNQKTILPILKIIDRHKYDPCKK